MFARWHTAGMKLAKPCIDVGLFTTNLEPMLRFWQEEAGLPFEELLKLGGGAQQHRHGMNGSVLKVNASRDPLPEEPPAGYRELFIASRRVTGPTRLADPDGNAVTLVPPGHDGITGIMVLMAVSDGDAFHRFYGEVLQFEAAGANTYRGGDSLVRFEERPGVQRAADTMRAPGYRYLTVQVWDVDSEHAGLVARGAEEGRAPVTLGTTARISFVRDPDGNWIEISQRASLTGPVPGSPEQAWKVPEG